MPVRPESISSQLERTSNILGEYMLKGWTLTDLHCDGCNVTPLMREPAAQASAANRSRIQFCAKCDGNPHGQARSDTPTSQPDTSLAQGLSSPSDPHTLISSSSSSSSSSTSTRPLTTRESPPFAPPPDRALLAGSPTSESTLPITSSHQRSIRLSPATRQQELPRAASPIAAQRTRTSEENSELISQRILQGYSLLQASCPNPLCEGIPLIGFPRAKDGTRDPRRMCVGCGTGYVTEGNMGGMRPVVPVVSGSGVGSGEAAQVSQMPLSAGAGSREASKAFVFGGSGTDILRATPESPRSKRRRELYETGEAINNTLRQSTDAPPPPTSAQALHFSPQEDTTTISDKDDDLRSPLDAAHIAVAQPRGTTISSALNNVSASLALTLDRLASTLAGHAAGPKDPSGNARYFVDVKLHTEAIRDVLECVERVRRVQ